MTVDIPAEYQFESPQLPSPVVLQDVGRYEVAGRLVNGKRLIYERKFAFGEKGNLLFDVPTYPQIKHAFDKIQANDAVTVSVKLAPAAASGGGAK